METTVDNEKQLLADIQNSRDERQIPIDKVGIRKLRYPIAVRDREKQVQHTIGEFSLTVDLPHHFKGTHMSRFVEILCEHNDEFSMESIPSILAELKRKLNAEVAHLEVRFPFFMKKAAPVTGKESLMEYDGGFIATGNSHYDMVMEVRVPVTTLCPCSKEISQRGAHNQRGIVTARLRFQGELWMEEIIEAIEGCASCSLYPLLKRPDEKFVTERAYDNPRFVEDMVREIALAFEKDERIVWFEIEVENQESIHAHNAYAYLQRDKQL